MFGQRPSFALRYMRPSLFSVYCSANRGDLMALKGWLGEGAVHPGYQALRATMPQISQNEGHIDKIMNS